MEVKQMYLRDKYNNMHPPVISIVYGQGPVIEQNPGLNKGLTLFQTRGEILIFNFRPIITWTPFFENGNY